MSKLIGKATELNDIELLLFGVEGLQINEYDLGEEIIHRVSGGWSVYKKGLMWNNLDDRLTVSGQFEGRETNCSETDYDTMTVFSTAEEAFTAWTNYHNYNKGEGKR